MTGFSIHADGMFFSFLLYSADNDHLSADIGDFYIEIIIEMKIFCLQTLVKKDKAVCFDQNNCIR